VNSPDSATAPFALPADDVLLHWQLDVAVRADELAHGASRGKDHDLQVWLQAEREIMERYPCRAAH
jgi:hypothetical protein